MNWYAQYYGDWHDYWENYTWKKLPGGSHRALGDARACYDLVKRMAQPMSCPVDYTTSIMFPPKQIGCTWMEWLEISIRLKTDKSYYPQEKLNLKLKYPKFDWLKPGTKRTPNNSEVSSELVSSLDYENIDNIEF